MKKKQKPAGYQRSDDPLIRHLHALSHSPIMAELLECRDSGYAVLEKEGRYNPEAAALVRKKLEAVDAAYAAMSERIREGA